ncbi:MAG: YbjN domain-containing protein [Rickettsiales bacterium]|nr:YbjN domain-containing protein [Rickettsiales bacterium]
MSTVYLESQQITSNPLDVAEQLFEDREWLFDRPVAEELVAEVSTGWCNYQVWLTWQPELQVLIFSCAYDTKLPEKNRKVLYPLLTSINEKMWLGHFDLCSGEGAITFRHSILLRGGGGVTSEQLEDLMDIAITECDRFFPAFQSVVWGGNSCQEAIDIAMMDPVGEA